VLHRIGSVNSQISFQKGEGTRFAVKEAMDRNRLPGTPNRAMGSASSGGNSNLFASPSTPQRNKKKVVYSDRYIPSRSGVDLQAAFSLANTDFMHSQSLSASNSGNDLNSNLNDPEYIKEIEANRTFDSVLKTELFGDNVPMNFTKNTGITRPVTPPPNYNNNSINRNLNNNGGIRNIQMGTSIDSDDDDDDYNNTTREELLLRTPHRQAGNLFTYQSPSKSRPNSSSLNAQNELYSLSPVRADTQSLLLSPPKKTRNIPKVPYRVLDAPDLADDFYLNLVDWGSQGVMAVGLGSSVYLWDGASGTVNHLCDLGVNDSICSVSWIGSGTHLAIGTNSGLVEIWDATTCKCTRTMTGHSMRASSLAWNRHILSSGSRDRTILHRDVREPAHFMEKLEHHKQEVCGLKWNVEENKLASGGNDNKLFVWDGLNTDPLYRFTEHQAAVKAIAWSPHQRGILASGGGTADRRIKIWNTLTGAKVHDIDTGSQVCNLAWSKNSNELVSTHGYSRNQIVVWKYSTMQQVASLTGHTYRVLYLSMSPDGQTIVTGAGDETLRFWNIFEKSKSEQGSSSVLMDAFSQLR
jgi:cell division cycle 20-like protein 1, cofactor of APC complex